VERELDFTGTANDVALIYDVGRSLANSGKWPEWKAGSEFKALRDKSGSKRPAPVERCVMTCTSKSSYA
jgi:hypothetical protein